MKTIKTLFLAIMAFSCIVSCQATQEVIIEEPAQEQEIQEETTQKLVRLTFKATSEETRTTLGEDGKSVVFKDGEKILVFDEQYNREFTVVGNGRTVEITGEVAEDAETFYALTPYSDDVDFNYGDDSFTTIIAETSLADAQTAVAGSFEDGTNIAAAVTKDKDNISFQNLLSYAKLTLDASKLGGKKIKSIMLSSEYPLSGDAIVTFGDKCSIAAGTITHKFVSISTDNEGGMDDGSYFLAVFPNAGGKISLTFTATDGCVATKEATLSKAFSAGVVKNLGTVSGLEWEEPGTTITVKAGTVLWSDDFGNEGNTQTDFDNALSISNYSYSGRSGIEKNSSSVTFTSSGYVKLSSASAGSVSSGHLWFRSSQNGTITTSPIQLYGVTSLVFSHSQSGSDKSLSESFYSSDNGSTWTSLGTTKGTDKKEYSFTVPSGTESISLRISHYSSNSQNTRIDNLQLVAASEGSYSGEPGDNTIVTTGSASSITASSATLNATFSNSSAAPREAGFEWSTSQSIVAAGNGNVQQCETAPSSTSGSFSASIDGLGDGVTYYYRAYIIVWENGQGVYYYGDVKSFRSTSEAVTPEGNQPGWYELPVMDTETSGEYLVSASDPDLYYAYHLCAGGETGPNGKTARNYTICFSAQYHVPLWVAAPRHSMYVGSSGRNDSYKTDDNIPDDIQYSSKSTGGGCNKGHMLGSAERTSSKETNKQVFFYSNIAPQLSSGFNTGGGGWNLLEDWVDTKVCADTLYEVVGTFFDKFTDGYGNTVSPQTISFGGRSDVGFPTMFYYVLLRTKSGNSGKAIKDCTADELMCVAMVRAHTNNLKGQAVSADEMMSVSDLEAITGFTYFANLTEEQQSIKNSFKASDWINSE